MVVHRHDRWAAALGAACVLAIGSAIPPSMAQSADVPTVSRLKIQVSPIADLHYYVRALAAKPNDVKPPEGFERAVEAARAMDAELKHIFLAWGLVEGPLPDCRTAAELAERFRGLPEKHEFREILRSSMFFRTTIELRKTAVVLGEALVEVEGRFLASVWPDHKTVLDRALERIQAQLKPKEEACLTDIIDHLGIDDPVLYLPVYLVAELPVPGSVTIPWKGGAVSYIGVEHFDGTQLYEMILREATNILGILGGTGAFQREFREELEALALSPNDDGVRDVTRTVLYVQAGATVRRMIDPAHRDVGETSGYYTGAGRIAADAIRPAWKTYLAGESTRKEAVARLMRSIQATLLTTPPEPVRGDPPIGPSPGGG